MKIKQFKSNIFFHITYEEEKIYFSWTESKFSIWGNKNMYFWLTKFLNKHFHDTFTDQDFFDYFVTFFNNKIYSSKLLNTLIDQKVIIDINDIYYEIKLWHNYSRRFISNNVNVEKSLNDSLDQFRPIQTSEKDSFCSYVSTILQRRCSYRNFNTNKEVSRKKFKSILSFVYWTYYKTSIWKPEIIKFNGSAGWYNSLCAVVIYKKLDKIWIKYEWVETLLWDDVSNILFWLNNFDLSGNRKLLIILWDLSFISKKYQNKSYLLLSLEAWLVAQNIVLFCLENNIQTCHYNGFNEKIIRKKIWLQDSVIFFTSIFLWYGN